MVVVQTTDELDPRLREAVGPARAAAAEEAADAGQDVGEHVAVHREDAVSATHYFRARHPGYVGWYWAVTVAVTEDGPVTVSEVVLLPGPDAVVAPSWVPWQERVRAGDLGVGDLMPPPADDDRLVPAYLASDDPAVEEVATELGLARMRVMSRVGRLAAAQRWQTGDYGPHAEMALGAPATCGTCGFYLPVAGSLRAAFGVCGNELSPADGHVIATSYGCGAHSEIEVELPPPTPVAELVYDDGVDLDQGGSRRE